MRVKEINTTPVFWANEEAVRSRKHRAIANQGSTRSSKTFSICQLIPAIAQAPKEYFPELDNISITVTSPSLPHLKRGARRDFLNIITDWGIYSDANFNKTDQIYRFGDSYVEFFGAEDGGKVRGPGRNILYVNEANLISYDTYKQLALRTTHLIIIDFNPADEYSWVYEVADKPGNLLIHSTYKNNLANLTKEQIEEIESLREADENLWRVYGLGLRGTSSETIYTHWKQVDQFPVCDNVVYGLDFGFNHPSSLIKCGELDGSVYWEELLYQSGLTNPELAYLIKSQCGLNKRSVIYCDHARPEAIEELKKAGLNALPADKAVWEGIRHVKSRPLYITRNSVNLLKEIRSYKWKLDKDGRVLEEPVKFRDDALDAGRYGTFTGLRKGPRRAFTG